MEPLINDDIFNLLKKEPILLDQGSLSYSGFASPDKSATFIIKNETFLAWPIKDVTGKGACPLLIYNITLRKQEAILEGATNAIYVVSTFPKNDFPKKFLYTADGHGILRIYNILDKSFKEVYKIESKIKIHMFAVTIFEDKFSELNRSSPENLYAIGCLHTSDSNGKDSLKIYNLNGEVVKDIPNPGGREWHIVNYYHDDSLEKTCIFFGDTSRVKKYDLLKNEWCLELKTDLNVLNLKFVLRNNLGKTEKWLVFTELYKIRMVNLDDPTIIRKFNLEKVNSICDIFVWDNVRNNLVLAIQGRGQPDCIKVLDFDTFEVLASKLASFPKSFPMNVMKVIFRNEKEESREGLVSVQYSSIESESSIVLYE